MHALGNIAVMEDWRDRIKRAICSKRTTMRDASLRAGLSPGYTHSILKDDKEPTLDRFVRLCDALGVSPVYILTGVSISPEAEKLLRLAAKRPSMVPAILALLGGEEPE